MTEPAAQGTPADLRLIEVTKSLRRLHRRRRPDPDHPAGVLLRPARAVRAAARPRRCAWSPGSRSRRAGRCSSATRTSPGRKPYQRPVNTVFQSYALFPHLDIFENVAFGLRRTKTPGIKEKVDDMLELVELSGLARRKPTQLSGGQQQRVAVARALINKPSVLLLDEPLGALDLKLRRQMQLELKRIQTEVGITFVHVTHDQEEAMTMADTIAVMNQGRVEQMGAPDRPLREPRDHLRRQLPRQVQPDRRPGDRAVRRRRRRRRPGTQGRPPVARACHSDGDDVHVGVRPEKISIVFAGDESGAEGVNSLEGVITDAVVHRRQHRVPRQDAVGPGARGVRPEHAPRRTPGARRAREPGAGTRRTPSPSTRARTPTPASRSTSSRPHRCPRTSRERRCRARRRRPRARPPAGPPAPGSLVAVPAAAPRPALAVRLLRRADALACRHLAADGHAVARATRGPSTLRQLHRRHLATYREQFIRSFIFAGLATVLTLADRLPARLHDRVQVGSVEELPARPGHRAVLHQLPHPDAGVADDPLRRRPRRPTSQLPAHHRL